MTPLDEAATAALDEAAELGGDVSKFAQAFAITADVANSSDAKSQRIRKSLLYPAARLDEFRLKDLLEAEKIYGWIVEMDSNDALAEAGLESIRRQLGKHEELVEMLLARTERATNAEEKAQTMAEIGRLYIGACLR